MIVVSWTCQSHLSSTPLWTLTNSRIGKLPNHLDGSHFALSSQENNQKAKDKHATTDKGGLVDLILKQERGKATTETQKGADKGSNETLDNFFNHRGGIEGRKPADKEGGDQDPHAVGVDKGGRADKNKEGRKGQHDSHAKTKLKGSNINPVKPGFLR